MEAATGESATAAPENAAQQPPRSVIGGREVVAIGDMLFPLAPGQAIESALTGNIWTGGTVYYVFDAAVTPADRQMWRDAAAEWAVSGVVGFVEGTGSGNYIQVKNSSGNYSFVGMIGGPQAMDIHDWWNKWIVAHEIGHALGLIHEHCRSDRDTYVNVLWNNIQEAHRYNFEIRSSLVYGQYDFDSVMHYPRNGFSSNGSDTLQPRPNYSTYLNRMGQVSRLSTSDRNGLSQRYGSSSTNPPSVRTTAATSVTATSAVITGMVMFNGGLPVDARHFYWGAPTGGENQVLDANISVSGNNFSATITGLTPNTTYYFRAYAHNASSMNIGLGPGWGSGAESSFTTPSFSTPTPTPTPRPTATPSPTAAPVYPLTVVASPPEAGTVSGGGYFPEGQIVFISAQANPGWRFQSWAHGPQGSSHSITVPRGGFVCTAMFVRDPSTVAPPTVKTGAARYQGPNSVTINGSVTNSGGGLIDARRFRWGSTPDLAAQPLDDSAISVVGDRFSATLSDLVPGVTYHFRAYAHNGGTADTGAGPGWGTGETLSFVAGELEPAPQTLNISTRLAVQTGDNGMFGGFIVTGDAPKRVIIRALGPALQQHFAGAMEDPTLTLFNSSGATIHSNDNWGDTQRGEVETSGVSPPHALDAAIVATLAPGAYTALLRGRDSGTGIALLEVYDLDPAAGSALANISTRGFVQTGDNVMIAGFILGGANGTSRIVLRAIGPSLQSAGVATALQDPRVEVFNADGTLVTWNDNWRDTDEAEIVATTLAPTHDREAAVVQTLASGAYTVVVRGVGETSGAAVVEVYNVR